MNNRHHPPKMALRFLQWFCPPELFEGVEGDLAEQFEKDAVVGAGKARIRYTIGALRFFRPAIILRNKFSWTLIDTMMIRNYLSVAFRNLLRNKIFSAINIFGLGTGLAAFLLIAQFVTYELSFDQFNDKLTRIYRVANDRYQNGRLVQHGTITYPTIGPAMAREFPEIEESTRLFPGGKMNLKVNDQVFKGGNAFFADDHFLSVFDYPLLAGNPSTALRDPFAIVITETLAKKFFGSTPEQYDQALGKEIYWGLDTRPYKITGVLKNLPQNSHLSFDALASYASRFTARDHYADDSWQWSDFYHYVVLKPGTDYKTLEQKFAAFSDRHFQGDKISGSTEKFFLQPLSSAHLYSDFEYEIGNTASGKAVWAMVIVAVFILFIAWINYINLTTSRSLDRAKEVGMRKVMGANRTQLIRQFVLESVVISFFAFIVALTLVILLQSSFNVTIGANLSLTKMFGALNVSSLLALCAVVVAAILVSAFYPAFVLSGYQPATVLKGKFQRSSKGQLIRKALVVFQFTSSAALITGTLIVASQLRFMNSADLGLNLHNTLIVDSPDRTQWDSTFVMRVESYRDELEQLSSVVSAATSGSLPGDRLGRGFDVRLSDQPASTHTTVSFLGADYNFTKTYGIELIAGRNLLVTDHNPVYSKINSVIINEAAVKVLGIVNAQEAVGKEIFAGQNMRIVGVIKNFHQQSLKRPTEPLLIIPTYSTYGPTSIRIKPTDEATTILQVETVYKKYFPGNPFIYSFIEDKYNSQYDDDNRFGKVISVFAVLAIIIAVLGLIGLSSYTAVQRTKEIGIRKVLGASLFSIISLLSLDFIKLIIVACIIAIPISWYPMSQWLQGYAYHISLQAFLFLVPVVLILLIAMITMSFQVMKTAKVNPAETLKAE